MAVEKMKLLSITGKDIDLEKFLAKNLLNLDIQIEDAKRVIDRYRRDAARLEARVRELELAQEQRHFLLDQLSGGHCLLRLAENASPVPLLVTQGFAKLLGYPQAELRRRLAADPLWRVPAADREDLVSAALQARQTGTPLLHTCRIRAKGGSMLLVSLEVVWQPQKDGWLVYAVCTDVTDRRQAAEELEVRSQLCELLLDGSRLVTFDCDCARGTVLVRRCGADGRRSSWTEDAAAPDAFQTVHPDDRAALAAAFRADAPRALEYRADYDGLGWRWYRLTLAPFSSGSAGGEHLLGKAGDVTAQKAAALRFQDLTDCQRALSPGTLACARLDLSADRILDAKAAGAHLTRVLFGNTADACLRHLRDNIPDDAPRARFDGLFRRDALLEAFSQGRTCLTLEHPFSDGGAARPVCTTLELAEAPGTLHTTAFLTIRALADQS